MDLSSINAQNVDNLSISDIENILRSIFTIDEWLSMRTVDRIHHQYMFTVYFKNEDIRQQYTLEQFLRQKRELFMLRAIEENIVNAGSSSNNAGPSSGPSSSTMHSSDEEEITRGIKRKFDLVD